MIALLILGGIGLVALTLIVIAVVVISQPPEKLARKLTNSKKD